MVNKVRVTEVNDRDNDHTLSEEEWAALLDYENEQDSESSDLTNNLSRVETRAHRGEYFCDGRRRLD